MAQATTTCPHCGYDMAPDYDYINKVKGAGLHQTYLPFQGLSALVSSALNARKGFFSRKVARRNRKKGRLL